MTTTSIYMVKVCSLGKNLTDSKNWKTVSKFNTFEGARDFICSTRSLEFAGQILGVFKGESVTVDGRTLTKTIGPSYGKRSGRPVWRYIQKQGEFKSWHQLGLDECESWIVRESQNVDMSNFLDKIIDNIESGVYFRN